MSSYTHSLFGRIIGAPEPLPAPPAAGPPEILLSDAGCIDRFSSPTPDTLSYSVEPDGTAVVTWLERVRFTVSPDGSRVDFGYVSSDDRALLFDYLLAQALSVALLQQGAEPLHATVVAWNQRAVAFIGDCGAGKSTLAAALVGSGAQLVTDDLLVIEETSGVAQPGAQRIKLTQEIAGRTIGQRAAASMADERDKWSYRLKDSEYCSQPVQLQRIYALRSTADRLRVETPSRRDAMRELLGATFNPLEQRPERLQRHMAFTAELSENVPVELLHVPWGLDRLRETAQSVAELMRK